MAVKGSGIGKGPDPTMVDQTKYDARSGAAKHPQTSFPTKWGMKDQTVESGNTAGLSPANPGTGPDASSPNPLDAEPRVKNLKRQAAILQTPWGNMKDANGNGVTHSGNPGAGAVLGEAILSGSSKLPGSPSLVKDSGASPKDPYA